MKPGETTTVTDASNVPQWRRIGILLILAISAGTGLAWSLEHRQHSIPGTLEARRAVIATSRTVRVREISVAMGQSVTPGQPLCQLIDAELEDRLIGKRREVAEYEAEIARAKASADVEIAWRHRELQEEIFEIQLKVAGLSQEKLSKQVEEYAWKDRLSATEALVIPTGTGSDDRRLMAILKEDAAAGTSEALTTQIALCEQRLKNLESLDKDLESKIRASSGVDVAEARLNGAKQELIALEGQVRDLAMNSSSHGTVGEIKIRTGDRVPAGCTVMEIFDDQQPHVIAQIPSHSATKFHPGTIATLTFPMNEQRTGIVTSLPMQTVAVAGHSESFLLVKIEPTGKLWPKLAIGSNVRIQLP
jgi:multidrug resistance efflux pump